MDEAQTPAFMPDLLIIPSQVAFDPELQPLDGLVYGVVYWMERLKDGRCYASNSTISKIVGSSSGGVQNALSRLKAQGYVAVTLDDKNHRTDIKTLVSMRVSSNDDGGGHQMMTRDSNTKTEKFTSETLQQIKKVYLLWLKHMVLEPQDLAGVTDPEERTAILKAASSRCRLTDKRRDKIGSRLADAGADMIGRAIRNLAESDFHRGINDSGWKASLEWAMGSYEKVEEWASK